MEDKWGQEGYILMVSSSTKSPYGDQSWGEYKTWVKACLGDKGISGPSGNWGGRIVRRGGDYPEIGMGLAVYHNTEAVFPSDDRYRGRPRISWLGIITDIYWTHTGYGNYDISLETKTDKSMRDLLIKKPIVRPPASRGDKAGFWAKVLPAGSMGTLHHAPVNEWRWLVSEVNNRIGARTVSS